MTIRLAINIPTCSPLLASSLNAAFQLNGVKAKVTFDRPQADGIQTEQLCCPVEPADDTKSLFIELEGGEASLKQTLLSDSFFMQAFAQYPSDVPAEDLFASECIVTSILARDITFAFLQNQKPKKLMAQAKSTAKQGLWVEDKLGTPNLSDMLLSFADNLLARGLR